MNNQEIVNLRKRLHYTQQEMADMLGISIRNYQKYESGEVTPAQPKQRILEKLANGEIPSRSESAELVPTSESEQPATHTMVRLFPVSAMGGSFNDFVTSISATDCEMLVSPIGQVDGALTVVGESMSPEYPNGSRVFVKRINEKAFIEWGKVYVLDTCNGSVIKQVVPSEREGFVKCLSLNPSPLYQPFEVHYNDIYHWFRVLMCYSLK